MKDWKCMIPCSIEMLVTQTVAGSRFQDRNETSLLHAIGKYCLDQHVCLVLTEGTGEANRLKRGDNTSCLISAHSERCPQLSLYGKLND